MLAICTHCVRFVVDNGVKKLKTILPLSSYFFICNCDEFLATVQKNFPPGKRVAFVYLKSATSSIPSNTGQIEIYVNVLK